MFLSDFGERDKSRVELKGLDASSFEVIMKFIYTGELEISIENAQSLIMVNHITHITTYFDSLIIHSGSLAPADGFIDGKVL